MVAGVTVAVPAILDPKLFIATTEKVYEVPFVSPVKVQLVFTVFVQEAGAVTEGDEVTEQPVIADPPFADGAVQLITEEALAKVAETEVGDPGTMFEVLAETALEQIPDDEL